MAEIRIQEKKRPIWPWILLILIIIAAAILIYFYLNRDNNNNVYDEDVPADTSGYYRSDTLSDTTAQIPGDEVEQYTAFVSEDTTGVFSKEYVMNGFSMLAGAVYNVVHNDRTSQQADPKTDSLISYTQNLSDTSSQGFSRAVNKSMTTAYEVITNLQKRNYPDLSDQIAELRKSVVEYNASKPVEAQERQIRDFFRKTGDILSGMRSNARAM